MTFQCEMRFCVLKRTYEYMLLRYCALFTRHGRLKEKQISNTKPDKNYLEPGLMSMSPIRLIAYSLYTFSRFFS
jgi:hypothetical protein